MDKIKVSEVFGPAGYWDYVLDDGEYTPIFNERWGVTQGEGRYVGQRSVFIRTFGCTLTCPSFGLHHGEKTTEPQEFAKNIHLYKKISDTPAAQYGCDSYFSVYPEFKTLSPMVEVNTLAKQAIQAAGGSFFSGSNSIHLILTGGEPMLGWQKAYPALIDTIRRLDPNWTMMPWRKIKLTIETNGTSKIMRDKDNIPYMYHLQKHAEILWSVSPKLTASGHTVDEAIKPDVIRGYHEISDNMYFKFVAQSIADLDEVDMVLDMYASRGVKAPVYIMPEGGTPEEYQKHATLDLVAEAVKRGYNITPRLQVMIGANSIGW